MLRIRSPRAIGSVIYFTFAILFFTILNPNWFTTTTNAIDPWIYWGAGDNPSLSFANNFGQTYYLQRYVVIAPQIVFNSIFGPYFSQLFVALFWLCLILTSLSILLRNQKNFILVGSLLIFDRTFMGMIGYSYTQSASITFILGSIAISVQALRKVFRSGSSFKSLRMDFLVLGILLGLLSNAYLFLFMLFAPALFLTLVYFIYKMMGAHQVLRYFLITLLGLSLSLSLLQILYFFVTGAKTPYLLAQMSLGKTLTTEKNPWGGSGGLQGLTEKILDVRFLHWWIGLIFLAIMLALGVWRKSVIHLKSEEGFFLVLGLSVSLIFFLSHFSFTNAIGYSWSALIMLVPQILGLHLLLNFFFESTLGYNINNLFLALVFFVWIIFFSQNLAARYFSSYLHAISLFYILFLGFTTLLIVFHAFSSMHLIQVMSLVLMFSLIIGVNLIGRSVFLNFAELTGTGMNASTIYSNVSAQRDILNKLRLANDERYRIWLTPDNSTELLSAQLYGYSLVSTSPGTPDCNQVEWMASSPAVVATFNPNQDLAYISELYLTPCGYSLQLDNSDLEVPDSIEDSTFSVGIVAKLP